MNPAFIRPFAKRHFNFKIGMIGALLLVFLTSKQGKTADAFSAAPGASSFVYTMTNPTGPNAIMAFQRDPRTGGLSPLSTYQTGGMGQKLIVATTQSAIVADDAFLYAVNAGSNDISAFAIQKDGSLRLLGAPVPSGGIAPATLALHSNLLYVGNEGTTQQPANYAGFRINSDGLPVAIEGATVTLNVGDGVTAVLFNSTGSAFIGVRLGGKAIDTFAVSANGTLVATDSISSPAPFGVVFNPANNNELISTLVGIPGAGTYFLSSDGHLSLSATAADARSKDPCWLAITNNGAFAWSSNFQPSSLSLFAIGTNGDIVFESDHDTSAIGNNSSDIVLDASGRFLYQLLPFPTSNIHIHVMAVTGNLGNGGLKDLDTISVPGDHIYPMGLVIIDR